MLRPEQIAANYQHVLERIQAAAKRVGRNPADVHLVVVTKTHPPEVIEAALQAGARHFGENYVEEAIAKIQATANQQGIYWHMIGHVQSRKARLVCEHFDYLHALDSLHLAQRLNRFAGETGRRLPVLLQLNVSGEVTKSGWPAWEDAFLPSLEAEIEQVIDLPNIQIKGLMTMPPFFDDPEEARPYFRRLRFLCERFTERFQAVSWSELSMGMSGDFEVAVEEGATWLRIGQAILGPRLA